MVVVALSGSSGFVGSALAARLRAAGHEVVPVVRGSGSREGAIAWNPDTGELDSAAAARAAVFVHLAGENVAGGRWTAARRHRIRDSRGPATERLCRSLAALPSPPVLLSASATGVYGDRGDEVLHERSDPGSGFLADVATAWEAAAAPLREVGARTVHLRIGMVLGRQGGALARMLPIFRLGLGGRIGNGRQWVSWIALDDLLSIVEFLLPRPDVSGPVLCVAPNPVRNAEFTKTLGRVLHRPTLLPVPGIALRALFGGMADAVLLASQRAEPRRLRELGFSFRFPELEQAMQAAVT